jgi:hypothetical protein
MVRAHQTAEQRKEYKKEWHKINYQNERILCKICGKTYIRSGKTRHCRSKRHQYCVQFNESKKITNQKFTF